MTDQPAGAQNAKKYTGFRSPDQATGMFVYVTQLKIQSMTDGSSNTFFIAETINSSLQKWHAPKKYSARDTSGLTAEISVETTDLNFKLTWKGEENSEPFWEKF